MFTTIAIPDSGPLMSLGRINRLDLLDRFNCPVVITDMVADEMLRGLPGAPDTAIFRDWFRGAGNRIQTAETSMGLLWKSMTPEQQALRNRIKDAEKTSIWQFSNILRNRLGATDYGLLLFEDDRVREMDFGPQLAKITTSSFLVALERMRVIPLAEALHRGMAAAGRNIQRDPP